MDFFKFFDWPRKHKFNTPMASAPQGYVAVTEYAGSSYTAEVHGTYYEFAAVEIECSGRPVDIFFQGYGVDPSSRINITPGVGGDTKSYVRIRLKRNGDAISILVCGLDLALANGNYIYIPMKTFDYRDVLAPPGKNKYTVEIQYLSPMSYFVSQGRMCAMEL